MQMEQAQHRAAVGRSRHKFSTRGHIFPHNDQNEFIIPSVLVEEIHTKLIYPPHPQEKRTRWIFKMQLD